MKNTTRPIQGIIPASISVFDEERTFDYDGFARQIEYLVEGGVHGLFLTGTTAEGAYLTAEERLRAVETARQIAGDRVTIYAVVARPGTHQAVEELQTLKGTAVSYAAAVTPYYQPTDQREIEIHYRELADASPVPFMLYNIPQNTHNPIEVSTVLNLADHPNVVGIKDSSGDFKSYTHGIVTRRDGFAWVQGEDLLDAPSFVLGAPAIVTGLGNVEIAPYVRMYQAVQDGDLETVWACQRRINALARIIGASGGKVIPAIKSATALQGRGNHRMRIAAHDLTPEAIDALRAVLREIDVSVVA